MGNSNAYEILKPQSLEIVIVKKENTFLADIHRRRVSTWWEEPYRLSEALSKLPACASQRM
jgi:hypothetical protein